MKYSLLVDRLLDIVKERYEDPELSMKINQIEKSNLDVDFYRLIFFSLLAKDQNIQEMTRKGGIDGKNLETQFVPLDQSKIDKLTTSLCKFYNSYILFMINRSELQHRIVSTLQPILQL